MNDPRPAYVQPGDYANIILTGPSLTIEMPDRADCWLPLSRISRLIISDKVNIATTALLACAEHGIAVIIHDQQNHILARVIGPGAGRTDLRQRLIDCATRPDWRENYAIFLRAVEHHYAIVVARRTGICRGATAPNARHLRHCLLDEAAHCVGREAALRTAAIYRRHALAWMQQNLAQLGLNASTELWLTGSPNLTEDLAQILALRMETARIGWLRAIRRKGGLQRPLADKFIIRKAEQLRPRMNKIGLDILNRLYTWLVEMA